MLNTTTLYVLKYTWEVKRIAFFKKFFEKNIILVF